MTLASSPGKLEGAPGTSIIVDGRTGREPACDEGAVETDDGTWRQRTIGTFGWASFLNDVGSDMVYPLWPMFVASLTGGNMLILGLLDGMGEALVSISQGLSGYLSDRYRRRRVFIWTGYVAGGLSRVMYALAPTWGWLVPAKALDRMGKMRGAPRDAMVADLSDDSDRCGNFGLLRAMDHSGAVVGVLMSILLFSLIDIGYRSVFLLAAVPSLLGAVLILVRVKDVRGGAKRVRIAFRDLDRDYRLFLLLSVIFALSAFSYSFLMIRAEEAGIDTTSLPLLYLTFNVVAALTSMRFGRLADRIGRKSVMMLAFGLFAATCVMTFPMSPWTMPVVFVLYGLHLGAIQPVQRAFVAELSPGDFRATGLGTFQMAVGLAALPASLVGGLLWELFGSGVTFSVAALLSTIAMCMVSLVKETA